MENARAHVSAARTSASDRGRLVAVSAPPAPSRWCADRWKASGREKRVDGDLISGIEHDRPGAATLERGVGRRRHGKRHLSGGSNSSVRSAARRVARACRPSDPDTRTHIESAAACRGPSCAMSEPSSSSTSEWTIDCGWITTSMRPPTPEQPVGSMTSRPLFMSVAESIVISAHFPGRVAQRVLGRDPRAPRDRAPGTARRRPSG